MIFRFLIFLLLVIPSFVLATEYKDITLKTSPIQVSLGLKKIFQNQGYWSLSDEEFSTIGINQIFLSLNQDEYITVKYDVTGDFEIEEVEEVAKGQLVHLMINNKATAFYFKNISELKVRGFLDEIKKHDFSTNNTSFINSLSIIPIAHADECEIPLKPNVTKGGAYSTLSKISVGTVTSGLMTCLSGIGSGAKDSVVAIPQMAWGALVAVGDEAKAFWKNPTGRASAYYQAVDGVVTGIKNFILLVGESLVNPVKGARLLKEQLGEVGAYFGKIFTSVANMPPELAIKFICSFVGGIGMDTIMAAFTGGAASGKLLLTLKRTISSLDKMTDFMKLAKKLKSFSKLGLDKTYQSKLFKKIKEGALDLKRLETYNSALKTESKLLKSYALRGLQCSL